MPQLEIDPKTLERLYEIVSIYDLKAKEEALSFFLSLVVKYVKDVQPYLDLPEETGQ
jgi:hypothetical protein